MVQQLAWQSSGLREDRQSLYYCQLDSNVFGLSGVPPFEDYVGSLLSFNHDR